MTPPHIINKILLEIDMGNLGDVNRLQEDISYYLWQEGVPQMERLFDQLIPADEVVRLDQVVIDLPRLSPQAAAEEFIPQVIAVLDRDLRDYLAGYHPSAITETQAQYSQSQSYIEALLYFLQYGRLPWWSSAAPWDTWTTRWQTALQTETAWQPSVRSLLSTYPEAVDRLVHQFSDPFLHQLILQLQPTWGDWRSLLGQAQQVIRACEMGDRPESLLSRHAWITLFSELIHSSTLSPLPRSLWMRQWLSHVVSTVQQETSPQQWRARLSLQDQNIAPPASITTANAPVEQHQGDDHPSLLHSFLHHLIAEVIDTDISLWYATLAQIPPPLSSPQGRSQRQTQSPSLPDAAPRSPLTSPSDAGGDPASPVVPPAESEHAPTDLHNAQPDAVPPLAGHSLTEEEMAAGDLTDDLNREQWLEAYASMHYPPELNEADQPHRSPLSPEETQAGLFIHQAGLVLLHPFLRHYFDAIHLLEGDRFQSPEAQQMAIHVLHYLATQHTHPPEYELILPKLLCGYPLNAPVLLPTLSQEAMDEAENLLQTVINYWEALKSTTPNGLREGFLKREGKLTQTGDRDWKLQVEQQSIDILLTRLPWGVSMVKLPWMNELLVVEWT
jgi:hypothetical protein